MAAVMAAVATVGLATPGPAIAAPSGPMLDGVRALAWGRNFDWQIGDGTNINRPLATQVLGLTDGVRQVGTGHRHSVAVLSTGTVCSWGDNTNGVLGDGSGVDQPTPVGVVGLTDITQVAAGSYHNLALRADGTVWAWGDNARGALGDGTTTDRPTPVQVPGLTNVIQVAAGHDLSYALLSDGTVMAWGVNVHGQLGDGTFNDRPTPGLVSGLTNISEIAAGAQHGLALRYGVVLAWGDNQNGQLGDGTRQGRTTPIRTVGLSSIVHIGTGTFFSLAVRKDGTLFAWGANHYGQLGVAGSAGSAELLPIVVPGISKVAQVTGGGEYTLAIRTDGSLWAWGHNPYGQLGDGTTVDRVTPAPVPGVQGARTVSGAAGHVLVVMRKPDVIEGA
jgi:alpha-tubulin suppressor-like RCC1 family protein